MRSESGKLRPSIVDFRLAIAGGVLALVVAAAGMFATGRVSGLEGRVMLEAMMPTTRFLCSAIITGSSTILALMLTVLGLSAGTKRKLKPLHYRRILQISFIDSILLIGAVLVLLYHSIPIQEAEGVPADWFSGMYYALLLATAALGGTFVTVVLMLFKTISDMIHILGPLDSKALTREEEEEEEEEEPRRAGS